MDKNAHSEAGKSSMISNGLSNAAVMFISAAVGFVLTPLLLRHLGEARYGIWVLASSVVGYFGLLDFGVGSALFRYIPLLRGQGNSKGLSNFVSTALAFFTLVGLFICLTVFAAAGVIARFFHGGPEMAGLVRLIGLATFFQLPAIVLNVSLKGYERFTFANVVSALTILMRGGMLWWCIAKGYGLVPMGWALVMVGVASLLGHWIAFRRGCREVEVNVRHIHRVELKQLLSLGGIILMISAATTLGTEAPKQIAAKAISLEALGILSIPLLLINYYRQFTFTLTRVFTPRVGFLSGQSAELEIQQLFLRGSRYMGILATGIALMFWTVGPSFMLLWTRNPSLASAIPALVILAGGSLVYLSIRLSWDVLFGLGHQKKLAAFEAAEAVSICVLSILLCSRMGITGAALALAIPMVVVRGTWQARYVCKTLKLGVGNFYLGCLLKSWAVAVVLTGIFWWSGLGSLINNWVALLLAAAALLVVYLAMVSRISMSKQERGQLVNKGGAALTRSWRMLSLTPRKIPGPNDIRT